MPGTFKTQPARQDNTRVNIGEDLKYVNSEKIVVDLSKIGAIPPDEKGKITIEREMLNLTFRTNDIVWLYNKIVDKKLKIGRQIEGNVYELNLGKLKAEWHKANAAILDINGFEKFVDEPTFGPDFRKFSYWEKILREAKPDKK